MIAQIVLSLLLGAVLLYAWAQYRRSPIVTVLSCVVSLMGFYFVWLPSHATRVAEFVGIGRGADLVLYVWACISLVVLLNLHLKLRRSTSCSPSWRDRLRLPTRPCQKMRARRARSGCPPSRKRRRRSRDIGWLTGQDPGKRQTKALEFIDDDHGQMLAAPPAFQFDDEIGL